MISHSANTARSGGTKWALATVAFIVGGVALTFAYILPPPWGAENRDLVWLLVGEPVAGLGIYLSLRARARAG